MRIVKGGERQGESPIMKLVMDHARTVFQISLLVTLLLYGYLLYGLFTGQLGTLAHMSAQDQDRVQGNIALVSNLLYLSILILVSSGMVCYYDTAAVGYAFVGVAVLLAYGPPFCMDTFFAQNSMKYTKGPASQATLDLIQFTAFLFGIPGCLQVLARMAVRGYNLQHGQDLTAITHGKNAPKERVPRPLLGVTAKCWQLPYCQKALRSNCPIYHARTRCWKQRVGCMCEDNIVKLATANAASDRAQKPVAAGGFVPLGDLITASAQTERKTIPTRTGPRGVKLPTNPFLTDGQKRERCRNCVIYNEHQRHKYELAAPAVVLIIPLLVWNYFDALKDGLGSAMNSLDGLLAHVSFSVQHGSGNSFFTNAVTGSGAVELAILICCTIIVMSWMLHVLEYLVFTLKM
jgi:hypothetical protein